MLEHRANAAFKAPCAAIKSAVEPTKESFFLMMGITVRRFQNGDAQGRGEDHRNENRQPHAHHDGDGKLLIDDARRAAEERHWNEDRRQDHADTD
ncbi:hypothetical protein D3C85_1561390 [compost metagenome]